MEDYIQQFIPRNRVVHHWFDIHDLEENGSERVKQTSCHEYDARTGPQARLPAGG
jgi:hypothetical protein